MGADRVVTKLGRDLLADAAELGAQIDAAITAEIPAIGDITLPEFASDVADNTRRHMDLLASVLADQRRPHPDELGFVREMAIRRSNDLVPLEALLKALRIGQRIVWRWCTERMTPVTSGGTFLRVTELLMQYVDDASATLSDAYLQQQVQLSEQTDRALRDLIEDLLAGRPEGIRAARDRLIGPDGRGPDRYVVIVARLHDVQEADARSLLTAGIARAAERVQTPHLVAQRRDETISLFALSHDPSDLTLGEMAHTFERLAATRSIDVRAGSSLPIADLSQAGLAYDDARMALRIAGPNHRLVDLSEMSVREHLIAGDGDRAGRLVPDQVRALFSRSPRAIALVETIKAFAEADMSIETAARLMHLHPNTVAYRLRRIKKLSGLDPKRFGDLLELTLAADILADAQP